jgi:hypothetical protein
LNSSFDRSIERARLMPGAYDVYFDALQSPGMRIASGGAAASRYHLSRHLTNTPTEIQNVYGMPAQYKKNMAAVEYRPTAEGAGAQS